MGMFQYGILFVFGALIVAALKSDYNTRVWVTIALVALMAWYAKNKGKR